MASASSIFVERLCSADSGGSLATQSVLEGTPRRRIELYLSSWRSVRFEPELIALCVGDIRAGAESHEGFLELVCWRSMVRLFQHDLLALLVVLVAQASREPQQPGTTPPSRRTWPFLQHWMS